MAHARSFVTRDYSEPSSGLLARERRTRPLRMLGKYRLLEHIGRGSTGDVYRAEHTLLGRRAAVKVLRQELAHDERQVERFMAEAHAINLVGHRNVIEVTDFAREPDGTAWFVMELLEGGDLATLMRAGQIPLQQTLEIGQQLCAALSAVHAVGIVHHDVKPENIFIARQDGQDVVKLVDFGIARLPEEHRAEEDTFNGVVLGSPPYMAPEQACGMKTDPRADLYAVGTVLFELITGRPVFECEDTRALLEAVVFTDPPLASAYADLPTNVRAQLDDLLERCLAKQPARRPRNARALGNELAAIRGMLAEGGSASLARKVSPRLLASDESSGEVAVAGSELLARCRPAWHKPALWLAAAAVLLAGTASLLPKSDLQQLDPRAQLGREAVTESATRPALAAPSSARTAAEAVAAPATASMVASAPLAANTPSTAPAPTPAVRPVPAPPVAAAPPRVTPPSVPAPVQEPPAAQPKPAALAATPTAESEPASDVPASALREARARERERERRERAATPRARVRAVEPPEPPALPPPVPALAATPDPKPVLRVTALPEPPPPTPTPETALPPEPPEHDEPTDVASDELLDPYAEE